MDRWDELLRLAREKHAEALAYANGDVSAEALLAAAEKLTGIHRRGQPAGDSLLDGGEAVLDPEARTIWFNQDADPLIVPFYLAHEYGHWWIDGARTACTATDLDAEASEERTPLGIQRVEGYSPQERLECQANLVGREFLLPTPTLRRWYVEEGLEAETIAARVGLPDGMVLHQLARALLTPNDGTSPQRSNQSAPTPRPELDPSQRRAAETDQCPFLLEAGPGTGKTKTLVGRIEFLLEKKRIPPSSILALTFSNKAAEEMRQRVALVAPAAAPHIWMGTFHAFGLELLRKYGTRIGLPPNPRVLDPTDALFFLEQELPALRLDHYQNLYEPTIVLRDLLGAISRAKDELVSPARYAELAARMRASASTDEAVERAEKAAEVARVYGFYQDHLNREHVLDFGDLIVKAVTMLREHADVRDEIRSTYAHILVDEYQDVNRASGVLLREIAGAGRGLWVVGDVRQSIYRFRGAAPSNLRRFADDFPGATVRSLEVNYRSQPVIVNTFGALAPQMRASRGGDFTPWQQHRPAAGGQVTFEIADDLVAEAEGLARAIRRRHDEDGVAFSEQAILCRSHTMLARFAAVLEAQGIPIFYLGDLFERPEIRDLLALISLACEGDGRGLVRVARFPEYDIPLADVRALLALAKERDVPFPRALSLGIDNAMLSERGRVALASLEKHLADLCYGTSAWGLVVRYLFVRSNYLRPLLEDTSARGQGQRVAIFQFLQFAHEQRELKGTGSEDPKRLFLRLVRRLEAFGDEKQLREIPDWANAIDAVRLLTVHASKGLEFSAVYVPTLGQGYFPARRQGQSCPPPDGMLQDSTEGDHEEEEECLLFVALSRARDHLCLSRARRYGDRASNPSGVLQHIVACLPRRPDGAVTWPGRGSVVDALSPEPLLDLPIFDVAALDLYLTCPRQYYYEYVLGLGGKRDDSAYVQFHRCVYAVLRWIEAERAEGRVTDEAEAQLYLAEVWAEQGPLDHPYEEIYRRDAEGKVTRALRLPDSMNPVERPTWEVALPHGRVRLQPDRAGVRADGTEIYQRLRTGKIGGSEKDKNIYALYQAAASRSRSAVRREIQIVSLSHDDIEPVNLREQTLNTRLDRYDAAIVGILEGRFPPNPSDRECPRCPHYFICPAAEGS